MEFAANGIFILGFVPLIAFARCAAPATGGGPPRRGTGHGTERAAGSAGRRQPEDEARRTACDGRRIACEGEDDRQVSRPVLPGDRDPGSCPRPAGQGGLGEARGRLRDGHRDRQARRPDARGGGEGAGARPDPGAGDRPRPGRRGDRLAGAGMAHGTRRRRRRAGAPGRVPRGDAGGGAHGHVAAPGSRHGPGAGLAGASGARLPGRLRPLADSLAQAAGLPLGGAGAVGGAQAALRPRGGDRGLRAAAILDGPCGTGGGGRRPVPGDAVPARRDGDRRGRACNGVDGGGRRGAHRRIPARGAVGRARHAAAPAPAALHHLDPAAGGGTPARLRHRRDHGDCPAPLRGRRPRQRDGGAHHLHAHRFHSDGEDGGGAGALARPQGVRGQLRPGEAAGIPVAGPPGGTSGARGNAPVRPGGARGDPADRLRAGARPARGAARPRGGAALRADPEPRAGEPDGGGPVRPGTGGDRPGRDESRRHRAGGRGLANGLRRPSAGLVR